MIAEYFLRGMLIGLVFGVPAGAIGALTIEVKDCGSSGKIFYITNLS